MPEVEKLKVSANSSNASSFDLPKDLELDTGFTLFNLNTNFLYAIIAFGLISLATFFLSTGSLEGQLTSDQEIASQIASDDALARFSDENIASEASQAESSLPQPPSILASDNNRASAETQADTTEDFVVENGILDLSASNFEFDKTRIKVPVGQEITVNFSVLEGTHDFTINGLVNTDVLSAGDSETVTFTLENAGEINFFCSLHPQMIGTIIASSELAVNQAGQASSTETATQSEATSTDTLEDDLDSILNGSDQADTGSNDSFESTQSSQTTNTSQNQASSTQNSTSNSRVVLGNSGPESSFMIAVFIMIYFTVYKLNLKHE